MEKYDGSSGIHVIVVVTAMTTIFVSVRINNDDQCVGSLLETDPTIHLQKNHSCNKMPADNSEVILIECNRQTRDICSALTDPETESILYQDTQNIVANTVPKFRHND